MSMRVFFFSKGGKEVPSSRYRCYFFAEALRREGMEVEICEPPPQRAGLRPSRASWAELRRLQRALRQVGPDDILYLQRPIHSTPFVLLVAVHRFLRRRRMVFDFCDPIFVHSPRKTALLTRLADAVVVSCEDLAAYARRFNRNVYIVPNSVPGNQILDRSAEPTGDHPPVIGWVGGARLHQDNLRLLVPVLRRLPRPFTFRLIGTRGATELLSELTSIENLDLDAVDWLQPEDVGSEITRFDIAVLPLTDTPFNRKLITKLLEYLAAGVPVVASPVGDNRYSLADGENGFLASNETEWVEKLTALLTDRELRARIGAAGLETLREKFSLDRNGERLSRLLSSLAAGSHRT